MESNKNQFRILHIHVLPVITGSGINTFLTMDGLKHKYHTEMACAPDGPLVDLAEQSGILVRPIKSFVSEVAPVKDMCALWQLYRLLRREKYDLVHTHNSKGSFIGRLAARLAGGPPVVYTVHGFAFHKSETWLRRTIFYALEKIAHRWSARVICISQPLVDLWIKRKLATPEKIRKIYSGIVIKDFKQNNRREKIRQELGVGPDDIAIGQVSKLWEGKGHVDIISAYPCIFEKEPRAKIFFIGDGPIQNKLENIVLKNKLQDRIIFLGHRRDVADVTSALDIAILASYYEGMGRVILEAMAAGLPVVATRVGGIVDLVVDQETGLLVEPYSPQQIADAVIRLAKDPALRKTMGLQGKKRVDNRFSAATMVEQIDQVYQEVLV